MKIKHNYLRAYRKQTDITQYDIGFLMNLSDVPNISRCEQGQRKPSIEMLLTYHLLFNVPIHDLFERQKVTINDSLISRLKLLLQELYQQEQSQKVKSRITFLDSVLTRLTA